MDRSVVFIPADPILPGGLILNSLCLLGIGSYLTALLYWQWALEQIPCAMSLLERTGIILTGIGFLKNVRYGVKSAHYGAALLGAVLTGLVALRHMTLHVLPGQQGEGTVVLGLHLYTLSALFALLACIVIAALMGVKSAEYPAMLALMQADEAAASAVRRPWGRIVMCLLFVIVVGVNLMSMSHACGDNGCNEELLDLMQLR